jgi:hypothetical protein
MACVDISHRGRFIFFFLETPATFFFCCFVAVEIMKTFLFNGKNSLQTYENTTTTTTTTNGTYNNRQTSASPTFNSLPRTPAPQKVLYSNGNGSATSGNLSELDSLLQDLSNARYGSGMEKKCELMVEFSDIS